MTHTILHSEQVTWQRQALAVLDDLLKQSLQTELPRLSWTIGNAGVSLVGRSLTNPSTARRGEIQAWADSLGLHVQERKHSDDTVSLIAHAKQKPFGKLWATIALVCDIFPDDEEEQ